MEVQIVRCLWIVCLATCGLSTEHSDNVLSSAIERPQHPENHQSFVEVLPSTRYHRKRSIVEESESEPDGGLDSQGSEEKRSKNHTLTFREGLWKARKKNGEGNTTSPMQMEDPTSTLIKKKRGADFWKTETIDKGNEKRRAERRKKLVENLEPIDRKRAEFKSDDVDTELDMKIVENRPRADLEISKGDANKSNVIISV